MQFPIQTEMNFFREKSWLRRSLILGVPALILITNFMGCSTHTVLKRAPSSEGEPLVQSRVVVSGDLRQAVASYRALIASGDLNARNCATELGAIYDQLHWCPVRSVA